MNYYFINSDKDSIEYYINKLKEHSKYLELNYQIELIDFSETNSLIIAMIYHSNLNGFSLQNNEEETSLEHNIRFNFNKKEGETRLEIPITFSDHFYFHTKEDRFLISNDLRFFNKIQLNRINGDGVFSYFKYKGTQANISFYKDIKRIQNGFGLTINKDKLNVIELLEQTKFLFKKRSKPENIKQKVFDKLSRRVNTSPENSIILFSGGIDSTLLALAAKECNRNDITLLNCCLSKNDSFAKLSRETAEKLGMKLNQVYFNETGIEEIFKNIHKRFSKPFIDIATLPTILMINEAEKLFKDKNAAFIDGTLADLCFGVCGHKYAHKYKRIIALPKFVKEFANKYYDKLNLWKDKNKVEVIFRNIRKTLISDSDFVHIVNPFEDFLYPSNPDVTFSIQEDINELLKAVKVKKEIQPEVVEMFYTSSLFRSNLTSWYNGRNILYPFLQPDIINIAFSLDPKQRFNSKEGKILLREILIEKMPNYPGFRTNTSFIPSSSSIFKSDFMKNIVQKDVFDENNEVLKYVNTTKLKQIWNYIQSTDKEINTECIDIIWGLIFLSYWFKQEEKDENLIIR